MTASQTVMALFFEAVKLGVGRFSVREEVAKGPRLAWYLPFSAGFGAIVLAICLHVPHVDHATVALLLAAFLITAIIAGQVAAQLNRRRLEAIGKQNEIECLYRFVNTLLETGNTGSALARMADNLVEIFGLDGVALYDKHTGEIVRRGSRGDIVSVAALRETANSGQPLRDAASAFSLIAIRHGGELTGSVGMCGPEISDSLLHAVAGRIGLGLARLYAIEETTEAEVVRRAEELKSAVLDAMAHEVRNPLNSIRIAVTTLLSGRAGESCRQEMLEIIDEEVSRMDGFLDEAVRLSRVEAERLPLKKAPEDIGRLIPAAIAEVGALAQDRRIDVRIPETLPAAECDADLIARVVKQLLSNAFRYSPPHSPLTVSAEFTGSDIVIDVVDRGPGVDEEEKDRIFEKYYRGRAVRAETCGTGLGLASAKAIVQAHGGRIWVTGAPAGGAAFHVSLPVAGDGNGAEAF